MLVTADWVLPVSGPPIPQGGVLVDGDSIAGVGTAAELGCHPCAAERFDFPGCTVTPGLVNAHTHLTLTALHGVVPPMPFTEWLPRLVAAMAPWEIPDHEASGVVGAEECLLSGVTAVGDIAYGAAEVASACAAGLGGVYYWELLGLYPDEIDSTLAYLRYPLRRDEYGRRVVCGLSPHSPYTSGPSSLQSLHHKAAELGVPSAIHVAESLAETQLMREGTGPLAATAARTAHGFSPPHASSVRYLADLGVLDGTTAVHLCQLSDADIPLLASSVRGAVTCPRSNRYLGNSPVRVGSLLEAGVAVGIGTDSSASNADLDLAEELRALRTLEPHLSADKLLEIATWGGARAIGVEDRFGSIHPGMCADLAVFRMPTATDPCDAIVSFAGRRTLDSLMSGGVWRVRDGRLLFRDKPAGERSRDANSRARAAVTTEEAPPIGDTSS